MAMIIGYNAKVTIGGVEIEGVRFIGATSKPVPSGEAPDWFEPAPPKLGEFEVTFTFEYDPAPLQAWFAALEERRWLAFLARQFRSKPGFRFADLMNVERN